jgi:hypothetical protein
LPNVSLAIWPVGIFTGISSQTFLIVLEYLLITITIKILFCVHPNDFFGFVNPREKNIYYISQPQYSSAWLWAAWPKFLQFRVGVSAAVVPLANPAQMISLIGQTKFNRRELKPNQNAPITSEWPAPLYRHKASSFLEQAVTPSKPIE